jgi:predicted metal-dependent hydrolase
MSEIIARDLKFGMDDSVPSRWSPEQPEFSHVANAFMAALPYLEPYFIQNLREALPLVADKHITKDARAFIQQEARHAQQHRDWNQVLARRFPGFDALERAIKTRLAHSRKRHSLPFRLAYTSGYEALTYQIACFILEQRHMLLQGADPRMLAMLAWHAAEEVEHKSVAFDVFQAVHGGYWLRVLGLGAAFVSSLRDIHAIMYFLMRADGLLQDAASRARLRALRVRLLTKLVPEFRHYLRPSYHPSQHEDPQIVTAWLAEHDEGQDLQRLSVELLEALSGTRPRAA